MGKIRATFDVGITFRDSDEPIEDGPEPPEVPTGVDLVAIIDAALTAAGFTAKVTVNRTDR